MLKTFFNILFYDFIYLYENIYIFSPDFIYMYKYVYLYYIFFHIYVLPNHVPFAGYIADLVFEMVYIQICLDLISWYNATKFNSKFQMFEKLSRYFGLNFRLFFLL